EAQALLEAVRAARGASEEDDFYDHAREQALKLIVQHQFGQAADLIRNLLNLFPGDAVLQRDLQTAEVGLLKQPAPAMAETSVVNQPEPAPEPPPQPVLREASPRIESLGRPRFLPYV